MRTQSLKIFCDAVDLGSFTAAANHNRVTPSSVSQEIRKLEQEYGVTLIERGKRRLMLTEKGETFVEVVRAILALVASLPSKMRGSDSFQENMPAGFNGHQLLRRWEPRLSRDTNLIPPPMNNHYFISRNYVEFGPLLGKEILDFKRRKIFTEQDYIRSESGQNWETITQWISQGSPAKTSVKKKASSTAKRKSPAQNAVKHT
jgi:Bacterial regulatory helix-turn-helix protein, lysR family